jgi:hypothetical protein
VYASAPSYDYTWRAAFLAGGVASRGFGRTRYGLSAGRRLGNVELALGLSWDDQVGGADSLFDDEDRGTWDDGALSIVALLPVTTRHWRFAPGLGLSAHRTVVGGVDRDSEASYSAALDGEMTVTLAIWRVEVGARFSLAHLTDRAGMPSRGGTIEPPDTELGLALVLGASY